MGVRKGQMFLISMVFLVGLIFSVQTALLGYTATDMSETVKKSDRFKAEDVLKLVNDTLNDPDTINCNSGKDNFLDKIRETQSILKEEYVRGIYSVRIIPVLDCTNWKNPDKPVLNLTVISQGPGFETKGFFQLKRNPEMPPVFMGIGDYEEAPGTVFPVEINMNNTKGIIFVHMNITYDSAILEFRDNRTAGRAKDMELYSSNGTGWTQQILMEENDNFIPPGEGPVLEIDFEVTGTEGETGINMSNIITIDTNEMINDNIHAENGSFSVE